MRMLANKRVPGIQVLSEAEVTAYESGLGKQGLLTNYLNADSRITPSTESVDVGLVDGETGLKVRGRLQMFATMTDEDFRMGTLILDLRDDEGNDLLSEVLAVSFRFPEGWDFSIRTEADGDLLVSAVASHLRRHGVGVSRMRIASLINQLGSEEAVSFNGGAVRVPKVPRWRREREERTKVQSLDDFFTKPLRQEGGDFTSVVWHPSAGLDWSPVVFYSRGYLARKENFGKLTPASFHVMTNMCGYDKELLAILESEEKTCYEDERTCLRIAEYEHVELRERGLWARPLRKNYHGGARDDVFLARGSDGFLARMEIRCKVTGYVEEVPLLYLLAENHATYRHFVSSGLFAVRHIQAVCEGLAFGLCSRTLLASLEETGLGLETLESVWAHDGGEVGEAVRGCGEEAGLTVSVAEMPLCFRGELFRLEGGGI